MVGDHIARRHAERTAPPIRLCAFVPARNSATIFRSRSRLKRHFAAPWMIGFGTEEATSTTRWTRGDRSRRHNSLQNGGKMSPRIFLPQRHRAAMTMPTSRSSSKPKCLSRTLPLGRWRRSTNRSGASAQEAEATGEDAKTPRSIRAEVDESLRPVVRSVSGYIAGPAYARSREKSRGGRFVFPDPKCRFARLPCGKRGRHLPQDAF